MRRRHRHALGSVFSVRRYLIAVLSQRLVAAVPRAACFLLAHPPKQPHNVAQMASSCIRTYVADSDGGSVRIAWLARGARTSTAATMRIANPVDAVGGLEFAFPCACVLLPMPARTPDVRAACQRQQRRVGRQACHPARPPRQTPQFRVGRGWPLPRWQVRSYSAVGRDCSRDLVRGCPCACRAGDDVKVVQEGNKAILGVQPCCRLAQRFMLSKGEQCRCEGIPLFAPFPLQYVPPPALGIPPRISTYTVGRRAPVERAHERRQLRHDLSELGRKRRPGHRVVRAAAIQQHQHRVAACRQNGTHVS